MEHDPQIGKELRKQIRVPIPRSDCEHGEDGGQRVAEEFDAIKGCRNLAATSR